MVRRRERRMITWLILLCLLAPLVPPAAAQESPLIQPREGSEVIDEPPAAPADRPEPNGVEPVAAADGEVRQIIIFVPGINTQYIPSGTTPQNHNPSSFGELKQLLLTERFGYRESDFIDFNYARNAYAEGGTALVPYSCVDTAQDPFVSGGSLRQLINNVHFASPNSKIVLVGHSLGGVIITWALDSVREQMLAQAIAGIVTIDSPLHGTQSDDIWWLYAESTRRFVCDGDGILTDSFAATQLNTELTDHLYQTSQGRTGIAAERLANTLARFVALGARVGTFGNTYDCLFNHVACGSLLTSLWPGGSGGLGETDHSWTQVYYAPDSLIGYSRMYDFSVWWPECATVIGCVSESHDYLLANPQPEMLAAIGNAAVETGPTPSQTSYVQVLALTCPGGGPDVSFEIGPLPFTIDPVECTAPTVSLTITDAAGNATPLEATGFMNLDLPAGSYTITEQGSGASASFELPIVDTKETQPPECIGRASCMSIVVSIPSTDAPIPSEPVALHEFFIGSWEGVGTQTNPAIDWPISVTFFPGNAGNVVGTVEYPTLGCGGDLVLTYVDPDDPFQTIEVSEDITYGEENCTDNGTFIISGTEGCCGMTFRWSSPDSGSIAEGWLDPALDDGSGAPGIEPPTNTEPIAVTPEAFFVDLGDPASEAGFGLGGWGGTQDAPENPLTAPSGDTSKRFQAFLADNSLVFTPVVPGTTYILTTEVDDGGCADDFQIIVDGVIVYEYWALAGPEEVRTHQVTIWDYHVTSESLVVTFRNTSGDDCGLAAVYNVRLDPVES